MAKFLFTPAKNVYSYKREIDCCSIHTWNDNLRDSIPHLNAVVTPETCSVFVGKDPFDEKGNILFQQAPHFILAILIVEPWCEGIIRFLVFSKPAQFEDKTQWLCRGLCLLF